MATTMISIEAYLKAVPDPDVEYVDGDLRERPMVSRCMDGCSQRFQSRDKRFTVAGTEIYLDLP